MATSDWEQHKAIILHIYILENTPLNQLISYMQQKHNFTKTKSQYEYQFKKWGVKKNLRKKDWQHLPHQLQNRRGKQSEITLLGAPLSPSRVRKAMQRYTAIPTANEFGQRPSSPEGLDRIIIRAQTPVNIEQIVWPSLPWFHFKARVIPLALHNPTGFLRTFFAALDLEERDRSLHHKLSPKNSLGSLYEISRNPWELRQVIYRLTSAIPNDSIGAHQDSEALTQKGLPVSIATGVLKLVFFRLSNHIPLSKYHGAVHDRFVLRLIEIVSHTCPEVLSYILSGSCVTTKAIKESIYGSAIRGKNYTLVSRLLQYGVDPYLVITMSRGDGGMNFDMGLITLAIYPLWGYSEISGMEEAILTCDVRLARILLNARASVSHTKSTFWEMAIFFTNAEKAGAVDPALEFVRFVFEHDGLLLTSNRPCECSGLIPAIGFSIARHNNQTARFLIHKAATLNLSGRLIELCGCATFSCYLIRTDMPYAPDVTPTPLHIAIISRNKEMIAWLLAPFLSCPTQIPVHVIQEAIIVSCLAGDTDTASELLTRHPDLVTSNVWLHNTTPLAATAWNHDNTLAKKLLGLGADIGPTWDDEITQTAIPTPIYIAASRGNTDLIKELVNRGADCSVELLNGPSLKYRSTPLQVALRNRDVDMVRIFLPKSNIIGNELFDAIYLREDDIISSLVDKGAHHKCVNNQDENILDAAVEEENIKIISLYFETGGRYRSTALYVAIGRAIKSKDYSIVRLLISHRPAEEIDAYEASAIVVSIWSHQRELLLLLLGDSFYPSSSHSILHQDDWFRWKTDTGIACKGKPFNISYFDNDDKLSPISAALLSKDESIVTLILQRGYIPQEADFPNLRGVSDSISHAIWAKFPSTVSRQRFLLLSAIESGDVQGVRECVKSIDSLKFKCYYLANASMKRNPLSNPLHLAVDGNKMEIVRLLLNEGAGLNFMCDSASALLVAVQGGNLDMIKLFLDQEANPNLSKTIQNKHMLAAALEVSISRKDFTMTELLISRGADTNTRAHQARYLPIEVAASTGSVDMVQLLLDSGVSLEGRMRVFYVRAVFSARQAGFYAIADYLKEYGSWVENDQVLYEKLITPKSFTWEGYRFEMDGNNWDILDMKDEDDWDSVNCSSEYSSGSSDELDSSNGVPDTVGHSSDESGGFCDELDLRNATGTAIEVEDGHVVDQLVIWDQENMVRIGASGSDNHTQATNFADDLDEAAGMAEQGWVGPFSNLAEVDEINAMFGVSPLYIDGYY
ncbi:putative multiple ankyrin repeats single kh domain [Rosellinia necatrix]|uniref:Putative multiple ankyrin repeats single kh domain n=1 Tax=Rosellinia necatrix TaxID=77044 RepID=A0A1W2TW52_ROSNE|nr:putative multiple ankyrin repeats single kh domain [Rosellinia necatrix]